MLEQQHKPNRESKVIGNLSSGFIANLLTRFLIATALCVKLFAIPPIPPVPGDGWRGYASPWLQLDGVFYAISGNAALLTVSPAANAYFVALGLPSQLSNDITSASMIKNPDPAIVCWASGFGSGNIPLSPYWYVWDRGAGNVYKLYEPLQETSHTNAAVEYSSDIINTVNNTRSTLSGINSELKNTMFRFTPINPRLRRGGKHNNKLELEHALNALNENGPVSIEHRNNDKTQSRVWLSAFKTYGHNQALPGSSGYKNNGLGGLMGIEYRELKDRFSVGLLLGALTGKQTRADQPLTFTNGLGFNYGIYGSMAFLDGFRLDAILTDLRLNIKGERFEETSGNVAFAKYSMNTLIGDFMLSHLWRLGDDYSFRINVGNTYVGNKSNRFNEYGSATTLINQSSSTHKSNEIYGGIGLRKGWMADDKILWRLTGTYEIGRQINQKGKPVRISAMGSTPYAIISNPLRINHYLNFNLSVLEENLGLKAVVAYTATISPRRRNQGKSVRHMGSLKFESRF